MSEQAIPQFGWIGLGSMGLGMAKNLQKHLRVLPGAKALVFTNRTMSRGAPLAEMQGQPSSTIAGVVQQSDIIFTSTSDDPVLEKIIDEIIGSGDLNGKVIVETTTVHPNTSREVDKQLTSAGAIYIAAPVFGASPLAESGQLLFIMGGPASTIDLLSPYIKDIMGRDIINVGEDPSKALLMKTTGNFITASLMQVISEAHVFAEKSGLGTEMLERLIEVNYEGIMYATSSRITSGAYAPPLGERPRSDLTLAIKDVGHGISAARDVGVRLNVAEVVMEHYVKAKAWADARDGRPLDSSSMYGVLREEAELDFESDVVKGHNACGKDQE